MVTLYGVKLTSVNGVYRICIPIAFIRNGIIDPSKPYNVEISEILKGSEK